MNNIEYKSPGVLCIGGKEFHWGNRTFIMGVVNATPDSFSGDGVLPAPGEIRRALDRAFQMQDEGADIIDIGGESTRPANIYPDAQPVVVEDEIKRVVPIIEGLAGKLSAPISIDTRKALVACAAVSAGASIVNDVSMLGDPDMAILAAENSIPIIVSHIRQGGHVGDVTNDVLDDLGSAVSDLSKHGLCRSNILVDPGIGFAKSAGQSVSLIRKIKHIRQRLGLPVLVGTSRKSFIGSVTGEPVDQRQFGTAATVAIAIQSGADIIRVHDVRQMVTVAKMTDAMVRISAKKRSNAS